MTWLAPLGLLGLLALPLIILLHLLRERSRRARISSLELWRWLEKEVRGPRLRRIPLTWILLLHLVTAALLAVAVAQPQVQVALAFARGQRLILVVDTTTSMGAAFAGGSGSRLAQAQAQGAALLAGLRPSDSAAVITAGPRAEQIADSAAGYGRAAAQDAQPDTAGLAAALAALRASGAGNDWDGALALAAAAVLPERANRIIILTDGAFQFPEHLSELDLPAQVEWRLVGGPRPNQAVITLAARAAASGAVQVFARLANFSDSAVDQTVTLVADGQMQDEYPLRMEASQVVAQAWTLPPGVSTVQVRLGSGDALPADDQAALGVTDGRPVEAVLVAKDPAVVGRALEALSSVSLTTVRPDDYSQFEPRELTVFHGWLPAEWPRGGVLVIEPPAGSALLPSTEVEGVAALPRASNDPLLADVDLTRIRLRTALRLEGDGSLAPVLEDANRLGLVWRGTTGASRLVVFAFRLDDSNLTSRADFPVLVANAVSALLAAQLPPTVAPGEAIPLPSAQLFPALTLTLPDGQVLNFGADRPALFDRTQSPGLYLLQGQAAGGETWQSGFGVNAGAPHESELRLNARPAFATAVSGVGGVLVQRVAALDLWPWAVGLVLLVLLVEAWLAWR
jgi:hypothetical protein